MQDGRSIQLAPVVCVNDCRSLSRQLGSTCVNSLRSRVSLPAGLRKVQAAGIKFTHRPITRVDSLHRFKWNLAWPTGTCMGPLGCVKFHLNRRSRVGIRPQKYEKFPLLVVASQGRILWLISRIFMSFYTPNYHAFVLRSYCWETARRSITPIFPCIL